MKTDLEELSPTRVRLTVEVPFEELKPSVDAAYKKVARQVRVPGFRPGKVPPPIIDRRFGRGVVLEQAVNDALPELYGKAVEEQELHALGRPEVEITKLDDGEELHFTAEVDIRPKFDVPDFGKLSVTVDDTEVTPDEVEEHLGTLRDRFAVLKGADRPAENGDYVSIDLSASIDGEALEDASTSGFSYEVGSGSQLEGLDDTLIGMSAGESTAFRTTLIGGEHADKEADVTVTVHSVKVKELPELDDEFAQTASEFDTLGELRADLRGRLERMKRSQQVAQARDRALENLVGKVDIPLPEGVLQEEIERRRGSIEQQLQSAGLALEQYLDSQGMTREQFDADLEEGAREGVKSGFVLDRLAQQEKLGVSEEDLTSQLVNQAIRMRVPPDALARHLSETGQIGALASEVLRGKALDLVLERAQITDASGGPVDIKAIQAEQAAESAGQTIRAGASPDDIEDEDEIEDELDEDATADIEDEEDDEDVEDEEDDEGDEQGSERDTGR
ncbi:MAG: trigger factor [Streptosporangiales bacterium]|nr:trigger factor [Streptosporangiales bacterium]